MSLCLSAAVDAIVIGAVVGRLEMSSLVLVSQVSGVGGYVPLQTSPFPSSSSFQFHVLNSFLTLSPKDHHERNLEGPNAPSADILARSLEMVIRSKALLL